jgi:two-component system response regulator AlgR
MKILVVDDEPLARARLLRLLARLRPHAECAEAGGGEQALALARESPPDLVLLDIRMPEMDGLDVAAALARMERPPAVIFCTAYDEYALEALQRRAAGYLLKPAREAELARALEDAAQVNRLQLAGLRRDGGGRREVSAQTHRGIETLPVDDIRCFIAGDKYVTASASRGELVLPDTLKELEKEFGGRFLRVHRNALVSLSHVARLRRDSEGAWTVELEGVEHRPAISRRHLAAVKQALLQR